MFCFRCGASIPDDSNYCRECGADLSHHSPKDTEAKSQAETGKSKQAGPWARFFARNLDVLIFVSLLRLILLVVHPEAFVLRRQGMDIICAFGGAVLFFCCVWVESPCLSVFGTTPGKWLFGIKVSSDKKLIGWLNRAMRVWFFGLGMGLPLVGSVARLISYYRLKKWGATLWDERGGFTVVQSRIGIPRVMMLISVLIASSVVFVDSNAIIRNSDYIATSCWEQRAEVEEALAHAVVKRLDFVTATGECMAATWGGVFAEPNQQTNLRGGPANIVYSRCKLIFKLSLPDRGGVYLIVQLPAFMETDIKEPTTGEYLFGPFSSEEEVENRREKALAEIRTDIQNEANKVRCVS
jgi:hypothetical protein